MRSAALIVVAFLLVLAGSGAVLAHAKMKSSTPADGATVSEGLSQIQLSFSQPMRLTLVRLHRTADDKEMPLAGALPKAFSDSAKVDVEAVSAGAYEVRWTAVSEDGHVMKGHFTFTVAAKPGSAPEP